MAIQLPIRERQVSLPGGSAVMRPVDRGEISRAGAPFGVLAQEGGRIAEIARHIQDKRDEFNRRVETNRRVAEAKLAFEGLYAERKRDPTAHATLLSDAQTFYESALEQALDGASPEIAAGVRATLGEHFANRSLAVREDQAKQEHDSNLADTENVLATYARLAAQAQNGADLFDALESGKGAVDDLVRTGAITQTDGEKRKRAFMESAWSARVRQGINDDPVGIANTLSDPSLMRELDPEKRETFRAQAINRVEAMRRERITLMERAERLADKAERERQERREFELTNALLEQDGMSLSPSEIQRLVDAREITPSAGAKFSRMIVADPVVADDRWLVNHITTGIYEGVAEPYEIDAAYTDGRITSQTATRLRGLLASQQGQTGPDNEYTRHRRNLGLALDERGPMSDMFGGQNQRKAAAYREYDDRVAEGEDPRAVADDLRKRAQEGEDVDFSPTRGLVLPRFHVGGRTNLDIDATRTRLVQAQQNGMISLDELRRQFELTVEWEQAMR